LNFQWKKFKFQNLLHFQSKISLPKKRRQKTIFDNVKGHLVTSINEIQWTIYPPMLRSIETPWPYTPRRPHECANPIIALKRACECENPINAQKRPHERANLLIAQKKACDRTNPMIAQKRPHEHANLIIAQKKAGDHANPIIAQKRPHDH
jgi:hypothetical protein